MNNTNININNNNNTKIRSVFLLIAKAASVLSEDCSDKTIVNTEQCSESEQNVVSYFTLTPFTPTENKIDEDIDLKKLLAISCSEERCLPGDDEANNEKLGLEITTGCGEYTPTGSTCEGGETIKSYCIHTDNYIYGLIEGNSDCQLTSTAFTEGSQKNVVQIGTPVFTIIDLSTTDISSILDKLFIVNCEEDGNCSRGAGEVIDTTDKFYEIAAYETQNRKLVINLSSNSCTTEELSNSESKCDGDEIITNYCIGNDKLIHGIISEEFESSSAYTLKIESSTSFETDNIDFETELYKLLSVECDYDGNCSFVTYRIIPIEGNEYEISFNLSEGKTQNKKLGIFMSNECGDSNSGFSASSIDCTISDTIYRYCIHTDRFIYGITITGTNCRLTQKPFTEGSQYNVVQIGTPVFTRFDLSTTDISNTLDKLFIVNCPTGENCSRGTGMITDVTGNSYEIANYETENEKIGMIINDYCIVSNIAASDETICGNSDTITRYCIGIDNLIHGSTGEGNRCKVTSKPFKFSSTNILKIESNIKFEKIDPSKVNIETEDLLYKLIIVNCDGSENCSRGIGVIIDETGSFYEILEDKSQNRKFVIDIKNSCTVTISNPESVCESNETITSYCIEDSIIYGIKEGSDGSCIVAGDLENDSTNLLKIESVRKFKKISVSKVNIETDHLLYKLLIVNCDENGNCSRGTGEVIDTMGNSYEISEDVIQSRKIEIVINDNCNDSVLTDLNEKACDNSDTITSYCIEDSIIHGIKEGSNGSCIVAEDLERDSTNLLKMESSRKFVIIDPSEVNIETDHLLYKLLIINCDENGDCSRGTGEVIDTMGNFYEISDDKTQNRKIGIVIKDSCTDLGLTEQGETTCEDSDTIISYCIKDKIIHGIKGSGGSCIVAEDLESNSINILKMESSTNFEYELYKLLIVNCDDEGNCSIGTDEHIVVKGNEYEISFNLSEGKAQNKKLGIIIWSGCDDIDSGFSASSIACTNSDTITDYCIHSDRVIYGITETGTNCKLTNEPFTEGSQNNVVQIGTPVFTMVDLSTTDINSILDKLFIVNCPTGGNCRREIGEVIDSIGNIYQIADYETENRKVEINISDSCTDLDLTDSDEKTCSYTDIITSYCIHTDKIIHGIKESGGSCIVAGSFDDDSTNVLEIKSSKEFEIIDPSTKDIETDHLLYKLLIIKCEGSSCSRGTQIITDGTGCIDRGITVGDDGKLRISSICTAGYYLMKNSKAVYDVTTECSKNGANCILQYCDGSDGTDPCTEISNAVGYVLYGGDGNTFLKCNGTKCTTVDNVNNIQTAAENTCGVGEIGKIVQTTTTNFCEKASGSGQDYSGSSFTYYLINASSGTIFGSGYVLVKAGYNGIVKVTDEGYYLDSTGTGNLLTNTLIYCDGRACSHITAQDEGIYLNKLREDLATSLIECKTSGGCDQKSSAPTNGQYYLDASEKLLIKCETGGCDYITDANGYYIYNKSQKKLISCITGTCKIIDGSGYYINAGESNSKQLINCGVSSCSDSEVLANTYVNSGMTLRDKEILCTSNRCFVKPYANNYYINNDDVKARCQPTYAGSKLTISVGCNVGYYLLTSEKAITDVSECTTNNECDLRLCKKADGSDACSEASLTGYTIFAYNKSLLKCSEGKCETVTSPAGYYVNANQTGRDKLIQCASVVCESVVPSKGYYINAGSSDSTKRIIKFTDGVITEIEGNPGSAEGVITGSCDGSSVGKIVKDATASNICISSTKNIDMTSTTSEGYYSITLSSGTALGKEGREVIVKIGNGAAVVVSNKGYYINADESTKANLPLLECINARTGEGEGISKTDTIFKSGCSKSIAGGLITESSTYKFCPSRQGAGVDFSVATENYGVIILETSSTAFEPQDSSSKNVLVKYGKNSVAVVDMSDVTWGEGIRYFVNGIDTSTKPLIQCNGRICKAIEAPGKGYYLNSGEGNEKQPFISYDGSNIEIIDPSTIFNSCSKTIDGGVSVMGDSINFCPTRQNDERVDMADPTTLKYYLVDVVKGQKSLYVNGNTASPIYQKILVKVQGHQVTSIENSSGYYLNSRSNNEILPVILCIQGSCEYMTANSINTNSCEPGNIINNGNYKICIGSVGVELKATNNVDYYFMTVASDKFSPFTGQYKVDQKDGFKVLVRLSDDAVELVHAEGYYLAKEGGQNIVVYCDNRICDKLTPPTTDIYLNAGIEKPLIVYNSGWKLSDANVGYYLNAGGHTYSNTLIKCTSTTECGLVQSPEIGYYVNNGVAFNAVIKCDGKECEAITNAASNDVTDAACTANIAKLSVYNGGTIKTHLCLGDNEVSNYSGSDDTYYLLTINSNGGRKNSLFTGEVEVDTTKTVLIKTGNNAAVLEEKVSTGYYISNGALMQCIDENAANCKSVPYDIGYYLNANANNKNSLPIIWNDGTSSKGVIADSNAHVMTACNANNVGKLIYSDNNGVTSICTAEGTRGTVDISTDTAKYYVIEVKAGQTTPFTGASAVTGNTKIAIKVEKNSVNLVTIEANEYIISGIKQLIGKDLILINDPSGYFINGEKENSLIECDTTKCKVMENVQNGYYVAGNKYAANTRIGCNGSVCEAITINYKCNESNGGKSHVALNNAGNAIGLCYGSLDTNTVAIPMDTTKKYYHLSLYSGEASVFTGNEAVTKDTNILVEATNNNVLLHSKAGYYFSETVANSLIKIECVDNVCTTKPINTSRKGYYVSTGHSGKIIKCDGSGSCTEENLATSCTSSELIVDGNKLCIGNNKKVDITGNEDYYVITTTAATAFGAAGEYLIRVGNEAAISVSPKYGKYYVSSEVDKIIMGKLDSQTETATIDEGYYHVITRSKPEDAVKEKLIYCSGTTSSKCNDVCNGGDGSTNECNVGYYKNGYNGSSGKPVINYKTDHTFSEEGTGVVNCSGTNKGKLVINNVLKGFCLDANRAIDFTKAGEVHYILDPSNGSGFGTSGTKHLVKSGNGKAISITPVADKIQYYITGESGKMA
ncbi:hypothetical protein BCR32DRAFT_287185 [Anaeromyces robustus]|uniref:Scaffoldin n=1 Tax=Anaeromyces robustus TaxID=1754192 RepID=A0A1Y1VSM8_9FUNG|nr:hypothetical protein BCR32DRAFT_287185 [Anaeromyces robustus]|eukprot:ORX64301.1 hypothetical protein BCR32DRAFT_287185 [Anaeromyces robustus]